MTDLFAGVSMLGQALDYHLDRQVMLNANIANVDTPGFRPLDLGFVPPSPQQKDGALLLARTAEGHIDPAAGPALLVPFEDPSPSPDNDQNAVDMDRELAKIAANTMRYETAAELMSRRMGLLRYAAGDGV
jgi:flagellar basal-body rod protein FlgB